MSVEILAGDNRDHLRRLIAAGVRVHSVVTDPPYGLTSITKRFGKEGSAPAKYGKDGAFARGSKGFMGKCFHPNTDIMTKVGWKRITDIQKGEIVATLNPKTRDLEWQSVEQTHVYPFEGDMVHVKHRSAEQMVTPNHRIVVSYDGGPTLTMVEPLTTKTHFHLFAQANPSSGIKNDPVIIVSEREYGKDRKIVQERDEFKANAFFRFLGLYLGDGYVCARTNDHPANDFFGFTVKKNRKLNIIRQTLTELGIRFTETPSKSNKTTNFYCYNFALLGFLKTLGKATTKHIPCWVFDRDASELEELYLGLMETDGCKYGKNQESYSTCSKQLAEDFQRLCLLTGRSAISIFNPGGAIVNISEHDSIRSDSYTLSVLQHGKRMYGEHSETRSNVIFTMPYDGNVYCIGVLKHHIIYTRFNGKPVWSGNSWDATGIENDPEFWRLIHDILLPGGYCFAFSGARTGHRQACAMEDAGFIMHPMHGWVYFQGMPHATNPAPGVDRLMGVEGRKGDTGAYMPASPYAQQWDGWRHGTQAQKPALEPIFLAQRPYSEKTGAANLLKHGVGAVNIDGCRVPSTGEGRHRTNEASQERRYDKNGSTNFAQTPGPRGGDPTGRWPSNLFHDGSPEVVALFPDSNGQLAPARNDGKSQGNAVYGDLKNITTNPEPRGDSGSAARFFNSFPPVLCHPKANKKDRAGSPHPTVKPIGLIRHLVRHITPPGGTVLDPFAGSGTTAEAAQLEGMNCILMEAEQDYIKFLLERFSLEEVGNPGFDLANEDAGEPSTDAQDTTEGHHDNTAISSPFRAEQLAITQFLGVFF